jgi:hypothetical protein
VVTSSHGDGGAPQVSRVTEDVLRPSGVSPTRRRIVGVAGLIVLVWLGYLLEKKSLALDAWLGVLVVLLFVLLLVMRSRSHITARPGGYLGRLRVSFQEDDFPLGSDFVDVEWVHRRRQFGRQGLSGGRMSFDAHGVNWRAGTVLTSGQRMEGHFSLPWSRIDRVDVSAIPFKSSFLGGALTIELSDGSTLRGEFLGSRAALIATLRQTPLGLSATS